MVNGNNSPPDSDRQPRIYESFCNNLHTSDSTVSSLPCVPPEESSIFGDADCGEPMKAQHLVIDFTPDDEIDTEESQKKCCEFWDFIKSRPEIQHLLDLPDSDVSFEMFEDWESETTSTLPSEQKPQGDTAVQILQNCDKNDLTKMAFAPKRCKTYCSLGPQEYIEHETKTKTKDQATEGIPTTSKAPRRQTACKCPGVCTRCPKAKITKQRLDAAVEPVQSSPGAVTLCKGLDEWDQKHPKSMEPPGPPLEHHPTLQRRYPLPMD